MSAGGQPQLDTDFMRRQLAEIYDLYRSALLNKLYYADALNTWSRADTTLDCAIFIGTSSSIGSYAIWKNGVGQYAWAVLSGAAAICGILKQTLQISKRVQRYSNLHSGHSGVYFDLHQVVSKIRTAHAVSPDLLDRYNQAFARYNDLSVEDDPKISQKRRARCESEVLRQIPNEALWTF